ncbi:MAG: hypothetical protein KDE27_30730 [Planctomycetes bacterium]|nr:hypothetical protein [Planctomycetota bacterium]
MESRRQGSDLKIPWHAALLFHLALLSTIAATLLDVTTFATNDYTTILQVAIACALGSMLLLALAARAMPWPGQLAALGLAAVDAFVVWNAGVERLLGW